MTNPTGLASAPSAFAAFDTAAELPVPLRRLREGDTLYGENERAEALGFDAIGMGHYTNEAVALEDSSVYVILLRDYFTQSPRNAAPDRVVFRAISHALMRRGEIADVMAAVAAEVRLARFLMHLSQQIQVCGQSRHHLHLRMSRRASISPSAPRTSSA